MTGTFNGQDQVSAQLLLAPGEVAQIILTGTPPGQSYTVVLEELDGSGAVVGSVATFSGDTPAGSYQNDTQNTRVLQLHATSLVNSSVSVAYTLSQLKASDVIKNFTDDEGNIVLSITKAGVSVAGTNINTGDNLGNVSAALSTINSRLTHAGV